MTSRPPPADGAAVKAFRLVLTAGLLAMLAANLPGQMSLDSVVALQEARTGVRQTWAPVAFSWVLSLFDGLVKGTGLYVTASAALLAVSLMSLPGLRGRASWLAPLVALAVVLTPQMLLYQGIVWRDVLFANLIIAGFVMLAHAVTREARPWLPVVAGLACLALAAMVRQNGLVAVLAALAGLAWATPGTLRRRFAWAGGALAAVLVFGGLISFASRPQATPANLREDAAVRILQHYDVVGAAARDPSITLDLIGASNPAARATIVQNAARLYTPSRIDTLDVEAPFRQALWRTPDAVMAAQWREVLTAHSGAYLAHRIDVFRWTALTPDLQMCLPVWVGVSGPADMVEALALTDGVERQDQALGNYAQRFFGTPVYSHLTWAIVALAVAGLLLLRRDPADRMIIALQLGALAFAASFLPISVACDYRYLYLLDLAAMTGLLYLALDPSFGRKAGRLRARSASPRPRRPRAADGAPR